MNILTEPLTSYVRGRMCAVLRGAQPEPAEARTMRAHRYREGRPQGVHGDPTVSVITAAERDVETLEAWADITAWAFGTLEPDAAEALCEMWTGNLPREVVGMLYGADDQAVDVWEAQAIARAAVRAAMRGLLGSFPDAAE